MTERKKNSLIARRWSARAVLLVLLSLPCVSAAQSRPATAEKKQNPIELAEKLYEMQSTELLEKLDSEVKEAADRQDDPEELREAARYFLLRAGQVRLARRGELVDQAIGILERVVKATEDPANWKEDLQSYRDQLMLAAAIGAVRVEPHANRLMYLVGGKDDVDIVLKYTKPAIGMLDRLNARLENKITDLEEGDLMEALRLEKYEQVHTEVKYRRGWVLFFRAIALEQGKDKRELLRLSVGMLRPFAEGDADTGVKYWSMLVCGMARRERDEHETAARFLNGALSTNAEGQVRTQALFEGTRNLAEFGAYLYGRAATYRDQRLEDDAKASEKKAAEQFRKAENALDSFFKHAPKFVGDDETSQIQVHVYGTVLAHYVYELWADAVEKSDPKEAAKKRQAAQKAIMGFLDKYSDDQAVQLFFLNLIADKYRGRDDYKNFPSVIVFAVARKEFAAARGLEDTTKKRKAYEKVVSLVDLILSRSDGASRDLHPEAKKVRAAAVLQLNEGKVDKADEVAAAFMELASEQAKRNPESDDAFKNAVNACVVYYNAIRKDPSPKLRQKFISTLRFLLEGNGGRWAKRAPRWYFDLGWQLEQLAQSTSDPKTKRRLTLEAIEAYRKVPPSQPQYMQAKFKALDQEVMAVRESDEPAVQRQRKARSVISALQEYASLARERIRQETNEARKEDMQKWGSRAAFEAGVLQAEVLGQDQAALDQMARLEKNWPDTPILRWAAAFRIQKLMDLKRVKDAIEEVGEYRQTYGAEKSRGLIKAVVRQVRRRIRGLAEDQSNPQELQEYRDAYYRFAQDLAESAKDLSRDRRYPLRQMYADALIEKGKAAEQGNQTAQARKFYGEALTLFQELRKIDEEGRQERVDEIRKRTDSIRKEIRSARGNIVGTQRLVRRVFSQLEQDGFDRNKLQSAIMVEDAVDELEEAINEPEKTKVKLAETISQRLLVLVDEWQEKAVARTEVDGTNVLGIARAYRALGQYDKAQQPYAKMVRDVPRTHDLFWDVQYEYCDVVYQLHKDDSGKMKDLVTKMRMLYRIDPGMGGYRLQFSELVRKAGGSLQ